MARILVIDDDDLVCDVVVRTLASAGDEVRQASDGVAGLGGTGSVRAALQSHVSGFHISRTVTPRGDWTMRGRRLIAVLLLITYLPACQTWRAEKAVPQELIESSHEKEIRVVRLDGTKQVLHNARIRADTLWGTMPEPRIALADVQAVETQHSSPGKSLLLAGGLITGTILVWAAWCQSVNCFDGQ
jgi:CheY-like chemotaxis protein